MARKAFWLLFGAVVVAGCCRCVEAALCEKCRDLMFVDSAGTCSQCGAPTGSGALKLCPKCSEKLHRCEHCLAPLDDRAEPLPSEKAIVTPAADALPSSSSPPKAAASSAGPAVPPSAGQPPAAPPTSPAAKPIDPNKPGTYLSGRWQYRLEINDFGTRSEGRSGWLYYDGRKLPLGQINDYYRTPWGAIYWVGAPQTSAGLHGWMPFPSRQAKSPGRELRWPTVAASAAPRPASRSAWFEIAKSDSGKRARVPVGQYILIRLPGNPTTGFEWRVAAIAGQSVRLLSEPQYVPPANSAAAGAGGVYWFKFLAVAAGATKIQLIYVRPWEKGQAPVDAFQITVEALAPQPLSPHA